MDRGGHARGDGNGDRRGATGLDAALRAAFDDLDANGGELEDLAALAALGIEFSGALAETDPALGAAFPGLEPMLHDAGGGLGLGEGLADMHLLPSRLAFGLPPKAFGVEPAD